jgi:hypothetical protein
MAPAKTPVVSSTERVTPVVSNTEQFYNAKTMAEDMGVCVELGRGGGAAVVAEAVETVFGNTSETRAALRQKADGFPMCFLDKFSTTLRLSFCLQIGKISSN